jgi:hypothetical protein
MIDDERDLLDIQQQLANAWVEKNRSYVERILAPEWRVTQADGSLVSRADVLRLAFESGNLVITRMVVDDVTVALFGEAAVVRGRTEAAGVLNGVTTAARIRFTDTFIKRDGEWRAVASHASALAI